jgi:hypothetical protein
MKSISSFIGINVSYFQITLRKASQNGNNLSKLFLIYIIALTRFGNSENYIEDLNLVKNSINVMI